MVLKLMLSADLITVFTFFVHSAARAMSSGTQELEVGSTSCFSCDTRPAMSLLLHESTALLGITAKHSPLAMSSVATTPISAQEPWRPILT